MDLDNLARFSELDPKNMLGQIDNLPNQLESAWALGQQQRLPVWKGIRQVLITGMGGSAIGADLLAAYIAPHCPVPVIVLRDYDLPAWATGPHTLVIANSHSGNTEETLSAFSQALENNCLVMALTTGGKLHAQATQAGAPVWLFEHNSQPRAAIGFSFGLLIAALTRLDLVPNPEPALQSALQAMRAQQAQIKADIPVVQNSAKRMAGQLMGRWVAVFGAGLLAPVARRFKGQLSELAKAWAQYEYLPEADHNSLAGILNPEELFPKTMMLFLQATSNHPRNQLRSDLTRKIFMLEGLNTDTIHAAGETPLANQWTTLHFCDYAAFYLAMAYGVDPDPVVMIDTLKAEMKSAG
jgi:glucose/mannose-6-phosphate isomerase